MHTMEYNAAIKKNKSMIRAAAWGNLKYYAKKFNAKDYILYNSIYKQCPVKSNLWRRKANQGFPGIESKNKCWLQIGTGNLPG